MEGRPAFPRPDPSLSLGMTSSQNDKADNGRMGMRSLSILFVFLLAPAIFAASDYPPSLHWRTITTDHFFIDYHQGEEELARRAAVYAEAAHARLVPMMG